jgi:hypothetical protein
MSLIPFAPLYLGCSRSARPLPRGVTGHVAHPIRSVHSRLQSAVRKDCQADDCLAREVQDVTDAFLHEEQHTLLAHAS